MTVSVQFSLSSILPVFEEGNTAINDCFKISQKKKKHMYLTSVLDTHTLKFLYEILKNKK